MVAEEQLSALKKELNESLTIVHSIESESGWGTEGRWLDETDLAKESKGKPEQLEHVKQTAKQMTHPQRKCTLSRRAVPN